MAIQPDNFNSTFRKVGCATSWAVLLLGLLYAIITAIGLLSLPSPKDPIGDPYFTMMELLTILIAPLMAISMVAVHDYASNDDKFFSLISLILMFIMAGITSCVHFVVLRINHHTEHEQLSKFSFVFSFKWPSVVYALDILAWDWFFALSVLFAAPVFKKTRLEKRLRFVLVLSGIISLSGLIGVPLQNMQIRNIGISSAMQFWDRLHLCL
jgi:hypothetical protein